MSNMKSDFNFSCSTIDSTQALAACIGGALKGGEVIELQSDLGGGKTTFVKGLARGMGINSTVQSPTFVISQIYNAPTGLELHHFDFYRLNEPGVMSAELAESIKLPNAVVAIEWSEIVHDILPKQRMTVKLSVPTQETRKIIVSCPYQYVSEALYNYQQNETKS